MAFDKLNFKNGDIFTTAGGNKYVLIDGVSYNMETGDYIIHERDGKHPAHWTKNTAAKADVVKVERFDTCPDADLLSQSIKLLKGMESRYDLVEIWTAENPRVVEARRVMEEARLAWERAKASYEELI